MFLSDAANDTGYPMVAPPNEHMFVVCALLPYDIFNGMGFVYNFLLFIFKCLLRLRSCLVCRSREDSKEEH